MPNLKAKLHNFIHLARDIRYNVNLAANEELFWNHYVKEWERAEKNKDITVRWHGMETEEDFLALLAKYASSDKKALEIGCGGGRVTSTGIKLFKHVYAADIFRRNASKIEGSDYDIEC